jgi:hypothetical protein
MLLFAATLSATALQAQNTEGKHSKRAPEDKAKMRAQHLDKKLDLTDEQTTKAEQIYLQTAQKMAQIKSQKGDDKQAMGQEMKAIRANTNQQLKAILTAEQWTAKEKMDAERKAKHKDGKGKSHGHKKGKNPNAADKK